MTIELKQRARAAEKLARVRETSEPGPATAFAARLVLFWERLWPALLLLAAPFFLIVVASLFGLFAHAPVWFHWMSLAAAGAASVAAFLRYGREIAWPSRREALARIEADGRLRHAPLQALEDRPFDGDAARALWRAHLADMARRARAARLYGPRATADERDPWSLRYAALGVLAVALVAAGPDRNVRLIGAFTPSAALKGGAALADLWIEPPAYTGKAPVYLLRAGERLAGDRAQIDAPEGAVAVLQAPGARRHRLIFETRAETLKGEAALDAGAGRSMLRLDESGLLRLRIAGAEGRWPIGIIPDSPPEAAFLETPATTDDARLALALRVEDDYGIASAALHLRLDPDQDRPLDAPDFDPASIRAERIIKLDGLSGAGSERRFDLDLQADPWAGLAVIGRLVVTDGAGQTGETEEISFRLPARPFFNPLARAVIEQRQTLAVSASAWHRAGRAFDALTFAPEAFYDEATDYLLLRTAFWRVMRKKGEDLAKTVEDFWPLALQLEDEALELARRRLEAARDALRAALESGASDAEIARLVEEMREALQQYLQALAQSGRQFSDDAPPTDEMLSTDDLDQMLDAIRDLSESGARNAARQALSDLEQILDNLRLAGRGAGGQGAGRGQGAPGESGPAGQAGDLIGRQRDLANRSFERGREPGARGDDLAREQRGLSDDLSSLLDQLSAAGETADPQGRGARALRYAQDEMGRAEEALRSGNFDAASSAMERAVAAMRDGAEALAEAEARQAREGPGEGESRDGPALDPLGRPTGQSYGRGVETPDGWDRPRARDVLDELRKRLSDGTITPEERAYLERLLERF
ncbi:DUF4175 domain-containing protein [Amphiplicatus metriothermophilus]|uniref:TIGR02302 family protein n=1 Tax=Amphiplicatus metriothermophilus TaxID=1519374 RepID=A0A239PIT4_9PROT|nr:DUF4175 family protein [Amphiplicatus metriothermophilus]MBB5517971.1 uncharacterized protein (TIGR02302 family) [Amphiplicatus metriothermophilus]SNT67696.1 TIGR02302 family protein [Amphiplicatus metriothermophilus]